MEPPVGGISIQARLLITNLMREGIEVNAVRTNRNIPKLISRVPILRAVINAAAFIVDLIRKTPSSDVVHIFSSSYLNFYLFTIPAVFIGRLLKKRLVVTYHGGELLNFLKKKKKLIKYTLSYTDQVCVPSIYLKRVFSQYNLDTTIIENIVECINETKVIEITNSPIFISARHLEKEYGINIIIDAFSKVHAKYPGSKLFIAGDGSQRMILEEKVKQLLLQNAVVFTGNLPNDDLHKLYNISSIFLNASYVDNQPVSIIEAFMHGLLVISTNAGGIPDMITSMHNGVLVECGEVEPIVKAIFEAIENPHNTQEIQKNGMQCADQYKWYSVREKLLSVYKGS